MQFLDKVLLCKRQRVARLNADSSNSYHCDTSIHCSKPIVQYESDGELRGHGWEPRLGLEITDAGKAAGIVLEMEGLIVPVMEGQHERWGRSTLFYCLYIVWMGYYMLI